MTIICARWKEAGKTSMPPKENRGRRIRQSSIGERPRVPRKCFAQAGRRRQRGWFCAHRVGEVPKKRRRVPATDFLGDAVEGRKETPAVAAENDGAPEEKGRSDERQFKAIHRSITLPRAMTQRRLSIPRPAASETRERAVPTEPSAMPSTKIAERGTTHSAPPQP